ncbi:MAG TPA: hypothetical protein VFI31_23440 [Pirellulales bacterium]|nr:hypothetical protein [Pirellulales bacterium]
MPGKRSAKNPFYVLLVVLGIAFALTACAYTVMTLKAVRSPAAADGEGAGLLSFLDQYGAMLMAGELALLAVATFGAIATDRYWMRRAYDEHQAEQSKRRHTEN